jgi:hypothetical protein
MCFLYFLSLVSHNYVVSIEFRDLSLACSIVDALTASVDIVFVLWTNSSLALIVKVS